MNISVQVTLAISFALSAAAACGDCSNMAIDTLDPKLIEAPEG